MAFTDVFGGELIFPSQLSYLSLTTAVDVTLQWPTEQQITGDNVVADFMDVDASAPSINIDMPSALVTAEGNKGNFNNVGANAFVVRDSTGGTIQSVGPGETWVIVLRDNTTAAGLWRTFQLGANVAVASASALAGAGIKAIGVLLNQKIDSDVEAATPFTVVDGDRAKCLIYTAGAGTCNLPSPGVVNNDWFFMLRNSGSGTLNIVPPSGVIDGGASINLDPNDSCFIFTDNTDFFTIGLSAGSTIAFDFVSIPVPGSGDFVLSGANLNRIAYRFTGALTGNRRIVVPNTTQQYWVDNQTTNAFTLEIDTAAGAGILIPQGQSVIVYCDGTDVINATSSTSVAFPITIGQGGTSATTVGGAQINLQVPPDSRLINTGAGLAGGGDLTGDRTLILDITSANVAPTPVAGDFFAFEDIDDNLTYKATIQDLIDLAGITVEDEGAPLATLASVLDFVGSGVVASGAGATKTITITTAIPIILLDNEEIQFGNATDYTLEYDGVRLLLRTTSAGADAFIMQSSVNQDYEFGIANSVAGLGIIVEITTGDISFVELSAALGFGTQYMLFDRGNNQVLLGFGATLVARTAAVSGAAYPYNDTTGGFLVNNNTTGTGNNERVLTFTDHQMTGGLQDDRNLDGATPVADNRLVAGITLRTGFWKFEIFCVFRDVGGTSNVVFDFAGSNISQCRYKYDFETADGAPVGEGASDDAATDQTVLLGGASEETMLRISGQVEFSANSTFQFRWAPTVNQIDTVSRMSGGWLTLSPIEIDP